MHERVKPCQIYNPLNGNPTKWSNKLKQFVGKIADQLLSVLNHFVGLTLKGFISQTFSVKLLFENIVNDFSSHKKMKFSIKDFFSKCDQVVADLVTFNEEILNWKLHFLRGLLAVN